MGKRVVLVVAALGLVAAGCAKSTTSSAPATTTTAQGTSVQIDGKTDQFNGAFTQYFPNDLSVHPGATVTFRLPHYTGEPHTVTLGTLVNAAAAKADALGAKATFEQLAALDNLPEYNKVPDVFFHRPPPGPPLPNQSAGQACYLDSGTPPLSLTGGANACAQRAQPEFKGTESFYNSGLFFNDGDSFKLKLASGIKPGTYSFMCTIHRAAMRGKLTVVAAGQSVPSAADVRAKGQAQFQRLVSALAPYESELSKATASTALAGGGSSSIPDGEIAEWGPKKLTVHKGETVTWKVHLFHNIALDPPQGVVGAIAKGKSGAIEFNGPVVAATNSVGQAPPITLFFPPPPGAKPITIDGGPWDGKAFRNSGLLGSINPEVLTYKTTFSTAGTYSLQCLIHPDMKGTVTVV